jgi:hypothetical protein
VLFTYYVEAADSRGRRKVIVELRKGGAIFQAIGTLEQFLFLNGAWFASGRPRFWALHQGVR